MSPIPCPAPPPAKIYYTSTADIFFPLALPWLQAFRCHLGFKDGVTYPFWGIFGDFLFGNDGIRMISAGAQRVGHGGLYRVLRRFVLEIHG